MKVLIELYDKDTLKNIVAPLTLRPDRVAYPVSYTHLDVYKRQAFRRISPISKK